MLSSKSSGILALVSISGGVLLTLISGLYVVKPIALDVETIRYGFPSYWFAASRKELVDIGPWRYFFVWQGFFIDFFLYGLLVAAVAYVCFRFLSKK